MLKDSYAQAMNNIKTPHTDAIIASVKKARGNRPFIVVVVRPANVKKAS